MDPIARPPRTWSLVRKVTVPLAFLGLACLFYMPQLLGLGTFPEGDLTEEYLPWSVFQRSELLAGRLPIWNPHTFSGHPFLADIQSAVYYPVSNLLLLVSLPFGSVAARLWWLQAEAALHLALAGWFTYLLVRELTGYRPPGLLAGVTFAFSGYLTGYPPLQLTLLRSAVWLPLVMFLLLRAFTRPSGWRWAVGAAAAYATAFLAGFPQTFLYASYVIAGWIALLFILALRPTGGGSDSSVSARPGGPTARRWFAQRLGHTAAFYLLTVALTTAQWWPSLEFSRLSVRAVLDYQFLSAGFTPRETWQMLYPGLLTHFSPLFVGVVPLGLAVLALVTARVKPRVQTSSDGGVARQRAAIIAFFGTTAVLALLVSYGRNGFLYRLFYLLLPGWRMFRQQERAAYLVAFGLSVLAGFGALALEGLSLHARRRAVAATWIALALGLAAFALLRVLNVEPGLATSDVGRLAGIAIVLGGLTLLALGRDLAPRARWGAVILLTVAHLFIVNMGTNMTPQSPSQRVAQTPEELAVQQAVSEGRDLLHLQGRVHNEYRVNLSYGIRAGVDDVWGASPLYLARYQTLFRNDFPMERMWRLLGVNFVLTWRGQLPESSEVIGRFDKAQDVTYLHRLTQPNPRAWIASEVIVANDTEAYGYLVDRSLGLDAVAVVPPEAQSAVGALGRPGASSVVLRRLSPDQLVADVESNFSGLLVVSENWMPGWHATVRPEGSPGSGKPTPVLRADITLLAVSVPPGRSTVELSYRPMSVWGGLAVSGSAALLLLGLAISATVRRKSSRKCL